MNLWASTDGVGLVSGIPLGLACGFGIYRGLMRLGICRAIERYVTCHRMPPLLLQLLFIFASYLLFIAGFLILPTPLPMPRFIAPLLLGLIVLLLACLGHLFVLGPSRVERAVAWGGGIATWWFCHVVSGETMAQTGWVVPGDVQVCRDIFGGVLWLPFCWIPESWTQMSTIDSGRACLPIFLIGVPWGVTVGIGLSRLASGLFWLFNAISKKGLTSRCTE